VEITGDLSKNKQGEHFGIVLRLKKHSSGDLLASTTIDLSSNTQRVSGNYYKRVANNVKLSMMWIWRRGKGFI
jgi:hypothetical protein